MGVRAAEQNVIFISKIRFFFSKNRENFFAFLPKTPNFLFWSRPRGLKEEKKSTSRVFARTTKNVGQFFTPDTN